MTLSKKQLSTNLRVMYMQKSAPSAKQLRIFTLNINKKKVTITELKCDMSSYKCEQ
jgi:hypothetical protein